MRPADMQGFDEFMNVVLDETEEVYDCSAKPGKEVKPRRSLGGLCTSLLHDNELTLTGRILLKGDNITLVQPVGA